MTPEWVGVIIAGLSMIGTLLMLIWKTAQWSGTITQLGIAIKDLKGFLEHLDGKVDVHATDIAKLQGEIIHRRRSDPA